MKLFYLLCFLPVTFGDTPVTCFYSKECVLPCNSKKHDIIHWYKDKIPVHSYYDNKDQLIYQSEEYKGRTSLFKSEIQSGNIALLLKDIRVQDEGRYKCYTADANVNDEAFVTVSVEAQVKSVDITLKDDTVICSTSGVYPKPNVSWSSSNPLEKKQGNDSIQTGENQLITVTSKLKVDDIGETYKYVCNITSKQDTTKILYTAILEQKAASELSESEVFITCPIPKDISYNLNFSYSTSILNYDSNTNKKEIAEQWKDKVTFHPENGTIKLSHLNEGDLGTYSCDITTAQNRLIVRTTVTTKGVETAVIILIVIIITVAVIGIVLIVKFRKEKKCERRPTDGNTSENENWLNNRDLLNEDQLA